MVVPSCACLVSPLSYNLGWVSRCIIVYISMVAHSPCIVLSSDLIWRLAVSNCSMILLNWSEYVQVAALVAVPQAWDDHSCFYLSSFFCFFIWNGFPCFHRLPKFEPSLLHNSSFILLKKTVLTTKWSLASSSPDRWWFAQQIEALNCSPSWMLLYRLMGSTYLV